MKSSIEELLIAAARNEPMAADERARLEVGLRNSAQLERFHGAQKALSAELAELRDALHALEPPEPQEDGLRFAFRAHRASRTQRPPLSALMPAAGLAAALFVAVVAVGLIGGRLPQLADPDRPTAAATDHRAAARPELPEAQAAAPRELATSSGAAPGAGSSLVVDDTPATGDRFGSAFRPLPFANVPSPSGAYRVVRVRIPAESLTLRFAAEVDGVVEAEILLGDDGLARGIRFVDAEPLFAERAYRMGDER